jgi:putative ABC transport system permease protein
MAPRLLRVLLMTYPPSLRHAYGSEIADAVAEKWRDRRSFMSRLRLAGELVTDAAATWRGRRKPVLPNMRNTSTDITDAMRLFRRSPLFGLGAVLTLALGIGATTATLSLADATLLRPLPVPDTARLVQGTFTWSYPDFRDLAAEHSQLSTVAAWSNGQFAVERAGEITQVIGAGVSGRYFELAGQQPVAGRLIEPGDESIGGAPVAVISERLWDRVFQRDPSVVGSVVTINKRPVTIVGVSPAKFRGFSLQAAPELFVSVTSLFQLSRGFLSDPGLPTNRGRVWLTVAGRLQDGVTAAAVDGTAQRIYYSHRTAENPDTSEWFAPLMPRALGVRTAGDLRQFMRLLVGASILTMLLTCATVANLLLVRAERRRHELSVRAALGASRGRIWRLLFVESLGIGLAGAIAGVGIAVLTLQLLAQFALPGGIEIADLRLTVNGAMLGTCAALGLLTALVFGIGPVMWAAGRGNLSDLRTGARSTSRQPIRSILVAVQVSLCVVLLGGGLAFGRALQHALSFNLGFNVEDTSITAINPSIVGLAPERVAQIRRQALERLRAMPGIHGAGWALMRPLSGAFLVDPVIVGGTTPAAAPGSVQANLVTDGYFEAMAIPLVAGRPFLPADTPTSEQVVVVSESLARTFWPDGNALGRRVRLKDRDDETANGSVVVGVVGDIHRSLGGPAVPLLYMPAGQAPEFFSPDYLFVRSSRAPATAIADVRALLREIDPALAITSQAPMAKHVSGPLMAHRLGLTLFLIFAALAVVLTTFGLYAVVATAVAQRTREIGIRVALGAETSRIIGLVGRQGVLPVVAGLAAGIAVCVASAKFIRSFMFELQAISPLTLVALGAAVGAIAVVAMFVPARRALTVDPATTLRSE